MSIRAEPFHRALRDTREGLDAALEPDIGAVTLYDEPLSRRDGRAYGFDPAEEDRDDGDHFAAAFGLVYGLGHDIIRYEADSDVPDGFRMYWDGNRRSYVDTIDEVADKDEPNRQDWTLFLRFFNGLREGVERLGAWELGGEGSLRSGAGVAASRTEIEQVVERMVGDLATTVTGDDYTLSGVEAADLDV